MYSFCGGMKWMLYFFLVFPREKNLTFLTVFLAQKDAAVAITKRIIFPSFQEIFLFHPRFKRPHAAVFLHLRFTFFTFYNNNNAFQIHSGGKKKNSKKISKDTVSILQIYLKKERLGDFNPFKLQSAQSRMRKVSLGPWSSWCGAPEWPWRSIWRSTYIFLFWSQMSKIGYVMVYGRMWLLGLLWNILPGRQQLLGGIDLGLRCRLKTLL